jgi:hypothetical protein
MQNNKIKTLVKINHHYQNKLVHNRTVLEKWKFSWSPCGQPCDKLVAHQNIWLSAQWTVGLKCGSQPGNLLNTFGCPYGILVVTGRRTTRFSSTATIHCLKYTFDIGVQSLKKQKTNVCNTRFYWYSYVTIKQSNVNRPKKSTIRLIGFL